MGIHIGMFEFDDPSSSFDQLKNKPGIYVLLHQYEGEIEILRVGEMESLVDLKRQVNFDDLQRQPATKVLFATLYTDLSTTNRAAIVTSIEREFLDD